MGKKQKTQKIVAAAVMGMNLVNSLSPMALAMQKCNELAAVPQPVQPQTEAQPLEYTVLPQALQTVEDLVFAKAEAANGSVTISSGVSNIDTVGISDEYGEVTVMNGATCNVDVVSHGDQKIYAATGNVGELKIAGNQIIYDGGTGSAGLLSSETAKQIISSGGKGTIEKINYGTQWVGEGAVSAYIHTANGGTQLIEENASGYIYEFNGGYQDVANGAFASAETVSGGKQRISGGEGAVNVMYMGGQNVGKGSGHINTMYDGSQQIGIGYSAGAEGTIDAMYGGTQQVYKGNTAVVSSMSGGEQKVYFSGAGTISSMDGGTQSINSGIATIKEMNAGVQIINGGTSEETVVNDGVVYYSKGFVQNMTVNGGEMLLNNDSKAYRIGGSAFNFNGGTVNMAKNYSSGENRQTYESLTIESFNGNGGTFVLNTDLATDTDSDKITIKNASDGANAYIEVIDASKINNTNVEGEHALLLVTDESGKATFTGKEIDEGGLFTYKAEVTNGVDINKSANEWYLTGIAKNVNPGTQTLISGTDNAYAMWRNTNDTLRKRLGELHVLSGNNETDGVWARYIGGKFDGDGFEGNYNLYQLGYDKAADTKSIYGFAVEKGGGNASYTNGSGEDDLFAGSLYGTWLADDGSYTDVVAKVGRFDTDLDTYGQYPDSASYEHNAYSLSVEYGKNIKLGNNGMYIEPQAQFIAGRMEGVNYVSDRGTKVAVDGINSYIGRIGLLVGQQLDNGNDIYFKASALHEFGGEGSIAMAAANGDTLRTDKDYGDTWFELGLGGNVKLGHASYFYGEVERSFGGDIDKEWQVNAGLRFEF